MGAAQPTTVEHARRTAADELADARPQARAPEESVAAPLPSQERRGPMRPEMLSPVRSRLSGRMLATLFRSVDALALFAVTLEVLSSGRLNVLGASTLAAAAPFAIGLAAAVVALKALGAYAFSSRERLEVHLARVATGVGLAGLFAVAAARWIDRGDIGATTVWTTGALVVTEAIHIAAYLSVRRWRRQGRLTPNIVVVGATRNAARLIEAAMKSGEAAVLGVFDDRQGRAPAAIHGVPVLGDTRRLVEHHVLPCVDRIVITVTAASQERVRELMARLRIVPNAVTLFLDIQGSESGAATLRRLADAPLAQVAGVAADERRALGKRVQDLLLALGLLVLLSPVLLAVALAVRLDGPGPILFRQRRHGFNNEVITVLKFRSMRDEASDPQAARQVSAGDDRITRVGRFIRRTSLDELPQLLNVIRGEMSLVGPRPHAIGMQTEGDLSSRIVDEYAWRHRMKPGITGWAQINGSRGPVDTAEAVRRRVELDLEYIERQSFWFDLYILMMTAPRLFGDRHAVR